jgi:hypothetical protein
VRFGDRFDDRQSEAAAVGGRLLRPAESLESKVEEIGGETLALVYHVQLC